MMNLRALTHSFAPGYSVTCRMEGDTFEMEDQRNWTDASYKTYVRPLALPWPYTLKQGERVSQRVSLDVQGTVPASRSRGQAAEEPVTVTLGALLPLAMPPVGLEVPATFAEDALLASDLLAS